MVKSQFVSTPADLKPQQANSVEFGLTFGFLADRINLDFTYYYIRSFDQILDSPTPTSSGVSQIRINNGIYIDRNKIFAFCHINNQ